MVSGMSEANTRITAQKIAIFGRFFSGRMDVYGTYDPSTGRAYQVKQPVTDQVFLAHLLGRRPYGVYLLVRDRTGAVVADFDEEDPIPPMEFVETAQHYDIPAYIERSKSKGYHLWIFLEEPGVQAFKARLVVNHILDEIGRSHTEVFPKQDRLDGRASYGNFVNAPLFGVQVLKGKTVFVDPADPARKPFENQWDFLESVQRVPETKLDAIIELNQLTQREAGRDDNDRSKPSGGPSSFGLPPCARRMLAEGVATNQRVACFRLAVQLRKAGLPLDAALAAMTVWAPKNHPRDGKRIITPQEVLDQTASAYRQDYRGCGCEDPAVRPYCDPACPILQKRHPSQMADDSACDRNSSEGATTDLAQSRKEGAVRE